jgi:hypothetical protein
MKRIDTRIVDVIVRDLESRHGLRREWRALDEEIRKEIRATWRQIVRQEIAKSKREAAAP